MGRASGKRTPRGRNCTLIRGPVTCAVFGTACSQVRWQLPPMTSRSPCPISYRRDGAAAPRPQRQGPRRAQRQDRHHGVLARAPSGRITVPGHAVPPVPVQAQPRGPERLAQFGPVVRGQRLPRGGQRRVRQRLVLAVKAQQPRARRPPGRTCAVARPATAPPRSARRTPPPSPPASPAAGRPTPPGSAEPAAPTRPAPRAPAPRPHPAAIPARKHSLEQLNLRPNENSSRDAA